MSLRPRYSLLTLLIFTALVAGGVKLWYGPHRVSIGEMPTVFEQAILEKGQALGFTTDEWQYEYDYIQSWQERQILSVTCFPTTMYYMIAMGTPDYRPGRKYLFSEANYHKYLNEDSLAVSSKDQVHCWIQLGREPADRVNLTGTMPSPLPLPSQPATMQELAAGEEIMNSYIVTAKGKIYALVDTDLGIQYVKIPLDKVADPEVRARIAEELHKLPTKP